ncbi:antitermination protein NusB [Elizabethkingia bruuniana]|uniref:Antitermination protein NusB n=1 Tax=Elizabethkingia bruuniana TaxID=1756149 RepID=A0A7T7V180_9FLAO|nr:transcription antitermination factor NusB [Elizabethkingia bruuniana]KGO11113.1 antitermination protein NusB [Elizabethkingia miricola]AQX86354.1 antitermination protein NusB [Elizabethkingia bruuniana]KUY24865.1 antitermination protein NusB [Elizabethkingia bruuniana]OPB61921.1 antitermination protein NusB [Elizabethkingia bruuniana]QDZ64360.1 antitermination protein NusB [Elizabethkingia bruuniana]
MVGRRQLREKVVQTLYAYQQNPKSVDVVLKNMMKEISKIYDLYVYELNFLVAIHQLAEEQIEIGKRKYIKSEEEANPNLKFVENKILLQIIDNDERGEYTANNKQLMWDTNDDLVVKTYQRIKAGKRYKDYMESSDSSFEDDQKFIGKLFLRYVAENEDLHDFLEGKEMAWADDIHIANSLIQKTIGFMKPEQETHTLIKIIKNYDDESFAKTLLAQTALNWDNTEKKLEERLQNWDLERVSLMDKVILITALSEMDEFKLTPSSIIINEYIEIAKVYSSDKSNVFINGILDKYAKDNSRI